MERQDDGYVECPRHGWQVEGVGQQHADVDEVDGVARQDVGDRGAVGRVGELLRAQRLGQGPPLEELGAPSASTRDSSRTLVSDVNRYGS